MCVLRVLNTFFILMLSLDFNVVQYTCKYKMPLHFLVSQKGKSLLNLNGFMYFKQRHNKTSEVWRCVDYKSKFCNGEAKTTTDTCDGDYNLLFLF